MSKRENTEIPELDICGLLALKRYERPSANRVEKNIQNTMRTVRSTSNVPSLLIFPDKSFAWMFAQPRYGVAALFVLFLGLHLLDRPVPVASIGSMPEIKAPGVDVMASVDTNQLKAATLPGIKLVFPIAGKPPRLSAFVK